MRPLLSLLSLLLFLPALALATDPFYEEWHYAGDTFTVEGELYTIEEGRDPFEILLVRGQEEHLLNYGECSLSKDGLVRHCFTESDYVDCLRDDYDCEDREGEPSDWCCPYDVEHISYEAGRALWGSLLAFTEQTPVIEVERQAGETLLKLGETTGVTLTFTNTGEDTVNGATYTERVPDGFRILTAPDFTRIGQVLTASVSLPPGGQRILTYRLKPDEYVTEPIRGNLTFTYQGVAQSATPNDLTISVPSPFLIDHAFTPGDAAINEEVGYAYALTNNDGEREMEAEVRLGGALTALINPESLPRELNAEQGAYVWKGRLDPGEQVAFELSFRPTRTGDYYAQANATMELDEEEFTMALQDVLSVRATRLAPELRLSTEELRAGQEYVLRFLLSNEEGETAYRDIEATLSGDLPSTRRFSVARIVPDEIPLVAELTLTAPLVEEERELGFRVEGRYETTHGEEFTFSETASITVVPREEAYRITQEANATGFSPGESVEIAVRVENRQDRYAEVTVTDILPSGALIEAGSREKEMSLEAGAARDAYTYRVAIPDSWAAAEFPITTRVYDQQDAISYEERLLLAVTLPEAEEQAPEEAPAEEESAAEEPEEKGLVRKVVDAIVGFLVGLFS